MQERKIGSKKIMLTAEKKAINVVKSRSNTLMLGLPLSFSPKSIQGRKKIDDDVQSDD